MFSFQGAALSLKRLNEIPTTVEISVNLFLVEICGIAFLRKSHGGYDMPTGISLRAAFRSRGAPGIETLNLSTFIGGD